MAELEKKDRKFVMILAQVDPDRPADKVSVKVCGKHPLSITTVQLNGAMIREAFVKALEHLMQKMKL